MPRTMVSSLPLMGIVNHGCGLQGEAASPLITPHGDCKRALPNLEVVETPVVSLPLMGIVNGEDSLVTLE